MHIIDVSPLPMLEYPHQYSVLPVLLQINLGPLQNVYNVQGEAVHGSHKPAAHISHYWHATMWACYYDKHYRV